MNIEIRPDKRAAGWLVWANLAIVYIVWGSTYFAIRVMVETMPPLLAGGARFLIAGVIAFAFVAWRRGLGALRVNRRELVASGLVGSALLFGGNGMVSVAEQYVPSGLAALVIASVPLWVVLLRALSSERVPGTTLAGVAVGFVGVAILVLPGGTSAGGNLFGLLLLVAAAGSWATGSFFSKRLPLPSDPFVSTIMQMLLGGGVMLAVGVARGEGAEVSLDAFSLASVLSLAYLIVAGSLLAFTSYTWLLQHAPISKVSTYAYVNPVIAIALGWTFLAESVTTLVLIGAALIVTSVAFIVSRETGAPRPRAAEAAPEGALAPAEA